MGARLVAVAVALALVVAGPLQPAMAQDAYDVGAAVVTVLKAPFNVALCGLGGAVALGVFVVTFGSAYRASARVIEEGCRGPWLVTGNDLRPETAYRTPSAENLHPAEVEPR